MVKYNLNYVYLYYVVYVEYTIQFLIPVVFFVRYYIISVRTLAVIGLH